MITYNAEGIAMPKIKKRLTSKWIKAVAASHGRKVGEVGYLLSMTTRYWRSTASIWDMIITPISSLSTMMRTM